jgi:hypothetical protein
MASFIRAIKVRSAVYKGEPEITILTSTIAAIGHDSGTDKAVVYTSGGHVFRVHETYDEVIALYEKIA